jgi:hypothetical protein
MSPDQPPGTEKPAVDPEGTASEGGAQRLINRFTRHYYEYENSLCRAQIDAASKQEQVNAQSAEAWQQEQRAAFKPAHEAYFDYLRVFHRAQINPAETGAAEVYRAQNHYVETYQKAQDAARKAAEDRRKKYAAECEAIQQERRAAQRAAFMDYVRAVRECWTDLDPKSFDARALGATAHSIFSVASSQLTISRGQVACTP